MEETVEFGGTLEKTWSYLGIADTEFADSSDRALLLPLTLSDCQSGGIFAMANMPKDGRKNLIKLRVECCLFRKCYPLIRIHIVSVQC